MERSAIGQAMNQVPGQLPELRPTVPELRMARDFPNDSPLVREWVGAGEGTIVFDTPTEEHAADPAWREGRIVDPNGEATATFAYRAEMPGRGSEVFFRALGWFIGEQLPVRGWLAGRANPVRKTS